MIFFIAATNGIQVEVNFEVGGHACALNRDLGFVFRGDFNVEFDNIKIESALFDTSYKFLTLTIKFNKTDVVINIKLDNGFIYDFANNKQHAKSQFELLQMFNMANLQVSSLRTQLEQHLFQVRIEKFMTKMENRIGK